MNQPDSFTGCDRRHFLKTACASIALPSLEAFAGPAAHVAPLNFVVVGTYLGWHQNAFLPKQVGRGYEMPATLRPLADLRDQFTVFSGLDHRAPNGHGAWSNFLCGKSGKAYSLDQMIADTIGGKSRFASIELTAGTGEGSKAMSFTRQGVPLPMIQRPSVFYKHMFISREDRVRTEYVLKSGRSALDHVVGDAKRLHATLPHRDRDKLDEYFQAVRDVETRMGRQLTALNNPIPEPDYTLPSYDPITPNLQIEAEAIMYDLMVLALDTDSTRVMSFFLDGLGQVFSIDGRALGAGYHGLSHHGNDPAMIRDLVAIETAHIDCLAEFLRQLQNKKTTRGTSLLDETVVLAGTGMGDASRHSNRNLPTLVAGGGFTHGAHIAVDAAKPNAHLLGDLYITLMQKLGVEADHFSNANRNMNELFS